MRGRIFTFLKYLWSATRWLFVLLAVAYIALVIYRIPVVRQEKVSRELAAKIQAQRLTMSDVNGSELPPEPDAIEANKTLAGIDANGNGIRDDVELAIFSEYPASSGTTTSIRAAELQYAMDLQTQLTEVSDTETWVAAVQERERGFGCLYDVSDSQYQPLENEVEGLVLNTPARANQYNYIEKYRVSYLLPSGTDCDVIT